MTWPNLFFIVMLACGAFAIRAQEFFISPSGEDTNHGTRQAPFASMERARDAVRELKGQKPREPITIWLAGGDYFRTQAFELTAADSGSVDRRIIWRSLPGQKVRLLGALKIHGFGRVTNTNILDRLHPDTRSHILEANIGSQETFQFGQMKSRGFARPISPAHCELFYGGKPMTLARWPNEGSWTKISGFPQEKARPDGHGGQFGDLETGFIYEGDRPRGWHDVSEIWAHGYWAWDWANSYERVGSIDLDKRLVKTLAPYGHYGFRKGQRVYFLNILEELDQPGEWFLDRKTARLYFWPPDNRLDSGKDAEVLLSVSAEPLFSLKDASFVTIEGLTIEGTRANAIEIQGGASNLVTDCVIRNIGNYGVRIAGGTCNGVSKCAVLDTGDGGVSVDGGNRQDLTPGRHFVEDCHFQRQGRWSKCYVPAILFGGVGHRASGNLIEDHPHCAILYSGNDHLIEYNEIRNIALETGDVGAIYTGRDYTYRGNRIRFNYIHHTGGVGMGSMGVYMDDCVSGTEIFGNIFFKVHRAVFLGGGRDHMVANNVFVDCEPAVELDGRGLDTSPVWRTMVDDTMRDRLANIPLKLYRKRYPEMMSLDQSYGSPEGTPIKGDAFKGVAPDNNSVLRNICVGNWLRTGWHAKLEMIVVSGNVTNAQPWLSTNDTVTATSFEQANKIGAQIPGFVRIPVEKIGLRTQLRQ